MKTTGICLVLILTFGLFGCLPSTSNSIDDSYAVYSVILKNIKLSHNDGSEVKLFVINEFTDVDKTTPRPVEKVLRDIHPDLPIKDADDLIFYQNRPLPTEYKEAIEDFKLKNKEPKQLTKSFDLQQDYEFITQNDFHEIMSSKNVEDKWKSFYGKYPNSSGFITFSAVGFGIEKKHAVVYYEEYCGSLCAAGSYIFLEKESGIWKEVAQQGMWAS